ncbi:TIGR02302 family protein [Litorisediminicola beolgyonensis]|uniref:TIGR02302 family protein n=1 Tax=Litorisediminicola beolgyonensis TaxID=1173614 RepID=A0ABW3ZK66_9RHOB
MTEPTPTASAILHEIRRPLALTRAGMVAERVVRAFWPLWSVAFVALAALMLGVQDMVPVEAVWAAGVVVVVAAVWALWRGLVRFRLPSREQAVMRLDATMAGRPIMTSLDAQAIGGGDAASEAVWRAHQARMRTRLKSARAPEPDLRVASADPFALRYVALLALSVAILFGSVMRVSSVTGMGPGGTEIAAGPTWEGWMEPPGYTRLPAVYLNDISDPEIEVPEAARITLRMYGPEGALSVTESVSGRPLPEEGDVATAQEFEVARSGRLAIDGPGGRAWDLAMMPDDGPEVGFDGEWEASYEGEASLPFAARDDFGVVDGVARIELALGEVDRRFGRVIAPETRQVIEVPLPMPIAGSRAEFSEKLVENFSKHPWANLPVTVDLRVSDAAGQESEIATEVRVLPGRRFFDPMAAAVIELRQSLLWNRQNARDVAMILRAISYQPDDVFRKPGQYLQLREVLRRIEAETGMDEATRDEIAEAMWELALVLEEGDLQDALERLQRAQDRLAEAMKNGASEQEIAELMQELREATDEYLRQLARQQQQEGNENGMAQNQQGEQQEMQQLDLQAMMDRIQELMEQGRMAEAQQALEELRQMMENMQVTQGQGQGQQSPGQQAMDDLAETLRDQQGLSDEAFRDLQEQFNPGQQGQQQQGQQGQQGQGQQGQQGQGQGDQQGQDGQGGQSMQESLENRQRALRQELNRQRQNLPGQGSESGRAAREALEGAEDAMEGAEQALREGDLPEAIDRQSEAMEALREGLRNLGEALAEEQGQQGQPGQEGQAQGSEPGQQRDPLGRDTGSNGQIGTDEGMLQGEDVYRRARELLDEIRRRTGDGERPDVELEYLERLLDRF